MQPTESGTLLSSEARTASENSLDQENNWYRGVKIFINVTDSADSPSVVFTVAQKDPISGVYSTLLASAAITGAGHTVLTIYPGVTAAANVAASAPLPKTWRVQAVHADADSITYSVGYAYLV